LAWPIARASRFTSGGTAEAGAEVVYVAFAGAEGQRGKLRRPARGDVERQTEIDALASQLAADFDGFHGLVHSIAFADYDDGRGVRPFHETSREQLLRTFDVSCFSLIAIANALRDQLARDASVVTISISTTRMASENYGFMAPVKAALDTSLVFLAKSFSQFSEVRFTPWRWGCSRHLPRQGSRICRFLLVRTGRHAPG
jgi:enoyl-[acyl-carrier protein] reductase I